MGRMGAVLTMGLIAGGNAVKLPLAIAAGRAVIQTRATSPMDHNVGISAAYTRPRNATVSGSGAELARTMTAHTVGTSVAGPT
eukprot:CAMPEP_0172727102 /NCGR_PEP_ID=MMETSP1074-20121228/91489_1 /TAXON_ID=2916 /ORGANISM="Ceratium fusus, Strain PA161109" /LENGTH=82 /DNA_ID=CAMNT_0013554217 /DNA_START=357 /DNA_END=605 /DNA_ORIENTATION=-